jgi:hypothetical protein
MNILNAILGADDGRAVGALAQQFGLSQDQASSALGALLPALAGGLQRNVTQGGGLESLIGALASGRHGQYLDNPDLLAAPSTAADGNAILGHILGSKDVSRAVASNAAASTGIGQDVLKRMLPVVATLAMAALSRQTASAASPGQVTPDAMAGNIGSLSAFLDVNRDGSIADDVMGFVGKLFGGR